MDLAGIHNVLSKSFGSSNRVNCTKAAFKALSNLRTNPHLKYIIEEEKKVVNYADNKPEDRSAKPHHTRKPQSAKKPHHIDKKPIETKKPEATKAEASAKETPAKETPKKEADKK